MSVTPDRYKKMQKQWKFQERVWNAAHYLLGLIATITGFLAAGIDPDAQSSPSGFVAAMPLISGTSAAVITFLSPSSRRKSYTEARDILRLARLRFEAAETTDESCLIEAVEQGQQIISRK